MDTNEIDKFGNKVLKPAVVRKRPLPPAAGMGRRKGVPNKTTKALKDMILGALDDNGGQAYLAAQAVENPSAFMQLIGKVLPVTLAGDSTQPLVIEIKRFGDDASDQSAE